MYSSRNFRFWGQTFNYLIHFEFTLMCGTDSTSGNLSKETQTTNSKEHKHPCVHCSITNNHQDTEAAQVSISLQQFPMSLSIRRGKGGEAVGGQFLPHGSWNRHGHTATVPEASAAERQGKCPGFLPQLLHLSALPLTDWIQLEPC